MLHDRLPVSSRLFVIICLVLLAVAAAVHSSRLGLDATTAQPPDTVAASEGSFTDYVGLTWSAVDGADKYRVYRDGRPVTTIDDIGYRDGGADAGVVNSPVITGIERRAGSVKLSWAGAHTEPGVRHAYSITAIVDGQESHHSPSVSGHRDVAAVTGYQVQVDAGKWIDVGDETSFIDDTVDEPAVNAGELSATTGDHPRMVELQLEGTTIELGEPSTYRVRAVTERGVSEPSAPAQSSSGTEHKRVRWQRAGDEDGDFVDIGVTRDGLYYDTDDPGDTSPRYYRAVVEPRRGPSDVTGVQEGYPGEIPRCHSMVDEPKTVPPMPFMADNADEIARLMKRNAEACLEEWEARRYQTVQVLGEQTIADDDVLRVAMIRAGLPGATMAEGRLYAAVETSSGWSVFRLMGYFASDHGSGGGTDRNTSFLDVERSELGLGDSPEVVLHFHQPAYHYVSIPLGEMPEHGEPDVPGPYRVDEVFAAVVSFDGGTPQFSGLARTHCRESTDNSGGVSDVEPFDAGRIELAAGNNDAIRVESPTKSGPVELEMPEEDPTYRQSCGE